MRRWCVCTKYSALKASIIIRESLVVIVESAGVRLGIMIDELVGQQQIVIKSLDTAITNSRSVSGAAILGNGQVALILDVHGLLSEIMS